MKFMSEARVGLRKRVGWSAAMLLAVPSLVSAAEAGQVAATSSFGGWAAILAPLGVVAVAVLRLLHGSGSAQLVRPAGTRAVRY